MSDKPMNLEEFLHRYTSGNDASRVVYDGEIVRLENGESPFIIIRSGNKVMVINPMALEDHISLDVHAFVDGESAGMGMFGMTTGRRHQLDTDLPAKSHGWDAVGLATVVLGEQTGN
jgi:hypothetical protein